MFVSTPSQNLQDKKLYDAIATANNAAYELRDGLAFMAMAIGHILENGEKPSRQEMNGYYAIMENLKDFAEEARVSLDMAHDLCKRSAE